MERKVIVIIPPGAPPKFCKSCGHAILWGHTPTQRKPCPADVVPIDGLYYSHFETCQNAAQHSKSRHSSDASTTTYPAAGGAVVQNTLL